MRLRPLFVAALALWALASLCASGCAASSLFVSESGVHSARPLIVQQVDVGAAIRALRTALAEAAAQLDAAHTALAQQSLAIVGLRHDVAALREADALLQSQDDAQIHATSALAARLAAAESLTAGSSALVRTVAAHSANLTNLAAVDAALSAADADLQSADAAIRGRLDAAEQLTPASSALVTAVRGQATNITALQAADAKLADEDIALTHRMVAAESLAPGSSALVTAVLQAGADVTALQAVDTAIQNRLDAAEALTPSSSALVTAVLKAAVDVTALQAADALLQTADATLKGRVDAAESLTPSSSALVTAVLNAATNVTALQTADVLLQAADVALATEDTALKDRITAAETLTPGSSALVTAVLKAATDMTALTGRVGAAEALTPSSSALVTAVLNAATNVTALQTAAVLLQAADAAQVTATETVAAKVAAAEALTPSSSALVTAVLKAAVDVTALQAADALLQTADATLKGRVDAAESLTPSSSALVTAVLQAGTDVTALQVAAAALVDEHTALQLRVGAAEALTPSSSALVTAVLNAATNITALQVANAAQATATNVLATQMTAAESLTPDSSALVAAVLGMAGGVGNSKLVTDLTALTATVNNLSTLAGTSPLVTGLTSLQSLPLVANGIPVLLWSELASTIVVEKSFSTAAAQKISIPGLPAGTQYVLADVFGTSSADDQFTFWMGRGTLSAVTYTNVRNTQPSTVLSSEIKKQAALMVYWGQADGFNPTHGVWWPSQIIPIHADGTFDMAQTGYGGGSGWMWMNIKQVSVSGQTLLGNLNALPLTLMQELATPINHEFSFSGPQKIRVTVPGLPAGARQILVEVYTTTSVNDHMVIRMGRNIEVAERCFVDARGTKPSTVLVNQNRHAVVFEHGLNAVFGSWVGSQVVSLYEDGTFDFTNYGSDGATVGWVYMVVRAFSIPSTSVAAVTAPVILFHQLSLPVTLEFNYSVSALGGARPSTIRVAGLPVGVRYVLADVLVTSSISDHTVISMGRGWTGTGGKWISGVKAGTQPSASFIPQDKQTAIMYVEGETVGWGPEYGKWFSSQWIPLWPDTNSFDFLPGGTNLNTNGWSESIWLAIAAAAATAPALRCGCC